MYKIKTDGAKMHDYKRRVKSHVASHSNSIQETPLFVEFVSIFNIGFTVVVTWEIL